MAPVVQVNALADRLLSNSLRDHPHGKSVAEIMAAALAAVDPATAVRRTLATTNGTIIVGERRYVLPPGGRVFVVGAGKAGTPMAQAAYAMLGDNITAGLVVVKEGHLGSSSGQVGPISLVEAGHPVPDERGLDAAQQMLVLLREATEHDLVLVLLSGGGSALLTLPAPDLTVGDIQGLTAALLRSGATISELNTIRKHCSQVSGGQLARIAAPAQVATLVISDVVGSPLDVIASGPTVPDPTSFAGAWAIIERYQLQTSIPAAVSAHIQRGMAGEVAETPKATEPLWALVHNQVIASNVTAAERAVAVGREHGFNVLLLTTFLEGEAREVGRVAAAVAREVAAANRPVARPALIVAGGETTVTLRGVGRGGRNQELALGSVEALANVPGVLLVALATDGGDGPTDAAGAVVTGNTLAQAGALGLDPGAFLHANDAYHFFAHLDDLLLPGPTLTNVNDLLLIVVTDE